MATVLVERAAGIVTVTMNRPEKKNAANAAMWAELQDAFTDFAQCPDDRVMVLTGAGGAFCSGADLTALSTGDGNGADTAAPAALMRQIGDLALTLHHLPKPTIAKVRGVAVGAGCNMALSCDLVVASEDACFSEIFSRRGLSLDFGGSWLLPRLVGLHRAKELALLADMVPAEQAARMGLINRVVPPADLDSFVDGWASRLAAGPPIALATTKSLLNQASEVSLARALDDEGRGQVINFSTFDTAEALAAFVEKREPRFEGR